MKRSKRRGGEEIRQKSCNDDMGNCLELAFRHRMWKTWGKHDMENYARTGFSAARGSFLNLLFLTNVM